MTSVDFKFQPLQFVRIHVHGLNLDGRVLRCIYTGGLQNAYECDYASDSQMKRGEFYEDELTAV